MDPAFPKVIRLDSRYRSGGTPTDCRFQLPYTVVFPSGSKLYISAFSCPVAFYNVDLDISDKLYVREERTQGGATLVRCRVLQLDAGNYTSGTLPTAMQDLLNTNRSFTNASYVVEYVPSQGCLRIRLTGTDASARFSLPSEDELSSLTWRASNWTGTADSYSVGDLDTMGDLLRLPAVSTPTTLLLTGLLNTSPIDVLYLHCPTLSQYNSIAPRGESDVIARFPVTAAYGFNLHWNSTGSDAEYTFIQGGFSELSFSLTNVRGRVVDLHGGFMSIELTIV